MKKVKKKVSSPHFCGHANEYPSYCDCPPDCYCREIACKDRPKWQFIF